MNGFDWRSTYPFNVIFTVLILLALSEAPSAKTKHTLVFTLVFRRVVLVIVLVLCVVLIFFFVFVLCRVYPMLSVSLDCSFLITPSVFSNVYLFVCFRPVSCVPNVASVLCAKCYQCLCIVYSWWYLQLMFIYYILFSYWIIFKIFRNYF